MLVLLSLALVLAATVLLVLGLLHDDGLTLIGLSIACSVAAAAVLLVALRRSRPSAELEAPAEQRRAADDGWLASDVETVETGVFPIADYDELSARQILPLLPRLYAHEIGVVEERELSTKARPEILECLAWLRGDVPEPTPTVAPAEGSGDEAP